MYDSRACLLRAAGPVACRWLVERPQATNFFAIDLMRNQFELMTDFLLEDGNGVNCGVEQGSRFEDEDEQAVQNMLEHDGFAGFLEDGFDGVDDNFFVIFIRHDFGYDGWLCTLLESDVVVAYRTSKGLVERCGRGAQRWLMQHVLEVKTGLDNGA